ncbi:hypothetical protein LLH23_21475 [bacterium]|nr:hypothetical protein [bacterium]
MLRLVLVLMTLAVCMAPLWAAGAPRVMATVLEVGKGGLPMQIKAPALKTLPLLTGPMALSLLEDGKPVPLPALAAAEPNLFELPSPVSGLSLSLRHGRGLYPFVDLTVGNTGASAPMRRVTVVLTLSVRPQADQVFVPATARAHDPVTPGEKPREYGYAGGGISTALPVGQVYSGKQDWGLAFFEELGLLVEPWQVTLTPGQQGTTVAIALPLSVPAGQSVRRRVYFAATEGDWRPALGAVLAQFPQAFVPRHPEAVSLDGPFVCSGGTPPDKSIAGWKAQGCKVVEIHCTFPFYGEYVPTQEPWTPLIDDTWHTLKTQLKPEERPGDDDWRGIITAVQKHKPPDMTVAKVNDYVDRLHAHGLKGLIYYNPTEAWRPWADEKFHDDVRYDAQGKPLPTWYESSQIIPDQGRPWGRYILEQLKTELRAYPKLDGVFFDQSAVGGHDLTLLCHEGTKLVRAQGGLCWWNGPYNMELAALADGMMDEGGGTGTYRPLTEMIQYYGLAGKAIVSLGSASPAAYAEMLAHGIQVPTVTGSFADLQQRWAPLFRWMLGRQWVLEAHALEPIPGFAANIYRVAGGNVAVTLVPEGVWEGEPDTAHGVPVTVKLPEADAIKGAYLLSPDWRGYHKLPLRREKGTLQVTVPRVRWAGMIVLARTGVFAALEGPLHVVQGQPTQARYVVDNWTTTPVAVDLTLQHGAAEARLRAQVKPGGSAATTLDLPGAVGETPTVPVAVTGKVAGGEAPPVAELGVEPTVGLSLSAPARVQDDGVATATIRVLSHLPPGSGLSLALKSRLVAPEPARAEAIKSFMPRPGLVTPLEVELRPVSAGEGIVTLTASRGGKTVAQAEAPLQVVATAVGPEGLKNIQGAMLELEVFGSDGGNYAAKTVSVNGVAIGNLPTGYGDSWHSATLRLSEAAVKALGEQNEITIDNQVGDAFKVRNLRLLLTMRGGILAVSRTDTGVYTGWTDWAYGEGKQFAAGQPLTGIRADMKIDPARQETYEWFFGTPQSGKLVLEAFGADGGQYAHKPVSVNGIVIADLPSAPSEWTEIALPLTPEALATLCARNTVQIENSRPPDAFKVRRLRVEIVNTAGRIWTTETDEGAYTSCGWDYAEGKVGSPITVPLAFREEVE